MIIFTSITNTLEIVSKIFDELESEGNDTQQAILKSVHLTLFPEAQAVGKSHTLCSSIMTSFLVQSITAEQITIIIVFLMDKLSLRTTDNDKDNKLSNKCAAIKPVLSLMFSYTSKFHEQ